MDDPASPFAPRPTEAIARRRGQLRQGDVLLVPADGGLPPEARVLPRSGGRVVLAEGEATGHAHAIRGAGTTLHAVGDTRLLVVTAPVILDHEEHAPLVVEPGTYEVVIQREYVPPDVSPAAFRRVMD